MGQDREYRYTSFNKLRLIFNGTHSADFHYGADRSRILRRDMESGSVVSRTHYVGNVEVYFDGNPFAEPEYRRYVAGVALVTVPGDGGNARTRYQHKDHLGSIVALSDESGYIVARMDFDVWGNRADPHFDAPKWEQWTTAIPAWLYEMGNLPEYTPRGFTGHEHVDKLGVIHMNGRIYDPHLARFLQADPLIENITTLNRYTYVHNNPLGWTDPSGYQGVRSNRTGAALAKFGRALGLMVGIVTGFAINAVGYTAEVFAFSVSGAAISGYLSTGTLKGAFLSAGAAAVAFGLASGGEFHKPPGVSDSAGAQSSGLKSSATSQAEARANAAMQQAQEVGVGGGGASEAVSFVEDSRWTFFERESAGFGSAGLSAPPSGGVALPDYFPTRILEDYGFVGATSGRYTGFMSVLGELPLEPGLVPLPTPFEFFGAPSATGGAAAAGLFGRVVANSAARQAAHKALQGPIRISRKHFPGAGGRYGKFADNVDMDAAVREALRSRKAVFQPNRNPAGELIPGHRVYTDLGRTVGSRGETGIRVIVSEDGRFITAFPGAPWK